MILWHAMWTSDLLKADDLVMTGSALFHLDDEDARRRICQEAGQRLAGAIGGTVKLRDGGDEVHVTGQYGQIPVRLVIGDSANIIVTLRTNAGLKDVPDRFLVFYDASASDYAAEQLDRDDEWDDDDEQKLFLSPRVYMRGELEELRQYKTFWDRLPAELTAQVVGLMEGASNSGSWMGIYTDEIELSLNDATIPLSRSGAQRVEVVLRLLTDLAIAAAQRWGAKRVPQGRGASATPTEATSPAAAPAMGPPGGPPPGVAPVIPVGTAVLVTWADGNRYPAVVSQTAPGQYLCVFGNGQQQWVGAPYVNRA